MKKTNRKSEGEPETAGKQTRNANKSFSVTPSPFEFDETFSGELVHIWIVYNLFPLAVCSIRFK